MRKINSLGSVANAFVDYDANTNPQGTVINAAFMNDVQNELIGIQLDASVAEAPGTDYQILKLIKFNAIKYSKNIGEYFWLEENKNPSAFSLSTPDDFFPAINLSKINVNLDITTTNYPLLVPYLRALKLRYLDGTGSEVTSWSATVSGSVVTMPNTTSSLSIIFALQEDAIVHGSYTNWRTLTINGVEYPITNVNSSTREITVTGTPTSGTQTVEFYQYRIPSSTTSARLFQLKGRSFISPNDSSGRHQNGLRVRDRFQAFSIGIGDRAQNSVDTAPFSRIIASNTTNGGGGQINIQYYDNGTNGTPRTGSTTHSAGISSHLYMWARSYIA
jgi:hypothetical protein